MGNLADHHSSTSEVAKVGTLQKCVSTVIVQIGSQPVKSESANRATWPQPVKSENDGAGHLSAKSENYKRQ